MSNSPSTLSHTLSTFSTMSHTLSTLSNTLSTKPYSLSTLSCSTISSTVAARKTRKHIAKWFRQIHQERGPQRGRESRHFTRGVLFKAKARVNSVQEKQLEGMSIDATTTSATNVRSSCLGEEAKGKNLITISCSFQSLGYKLFLCTFHQPKVTS